MSERQKTNLLYAFMIILGVAMMLFATWRRK